MKIKLDENAFPPTRAHLTDAGLDLYAKADEPIVRIHPHNSAIFRTGVHIKLPPNTAGVIISKSGLNTKYNITSTGLIDEGYDGEIVVKLYNHGDDYYIVHGGDKISQLIVVPVLYEKVEIVEDLKQISERGSDGFGSTGR